MPIDRFSPVKRLALRSSAKLNTARKALPGVPLSRSRISLPIRRRMIGFRDTDAGPGFWIMPSPSRPSMPRSHATPLDRAWQTAPISSKMALTTSQGSNRRAASDKPAQGASLARRLHITLYYVGTVMPATLPQLFSHCMRVRSHERTPRQSRRLCPDHRAVIY